MHCQFAVPPKVELADISPRLFHPLFLLAALGTLVRRLVLAPHQYAINGRMGHFSVPGTTPKFLVKA
jgi:hypothetical protein